VIISATNRQNLFTFILTIIFIWDQQVSTDCLSLLKLLVTCSVSFCLRFVKRVDGKAEMFTLLESEYIQIWPVNVN